MEVSLGIWLQIHQVLMARLQWQIGHSSLGVSIGTWQTTLKRMLPLEFDQAMGWMNRL